MRAIARLFHWRWVAHTQMGPGLLPRRFQAPAEGKPLEELHGLHTQIGTQQGLGLKFSLRIPHEHPLDSWRTRHNSVIIAKRLSATITNVRSGTQRHPTRCICRAQSFRFFCRGPRS